MEEYAVIVAGGNGSRMNNSIPKQFITIGGLPILMHTIKKFQQYSLTLKIVLVLPENQIEEWQYLCEKYVFNNHNITLVIGGNTRFQSCKNGISSIENKNAIIAIHDGVRPFVALTTIAQSFKLAFEKGNAVATVVSKDSARYNNDLDYFEAIERSKLRLVQTPQTFQNKILIDAYNQPESINFTDDASVVENAGYKINLIEGSYENIKITTIEDLALAEVLLKYNY